jgi:hypothetical protein
VLSIVAVLLIYIRSCDRAVRDERGLRKDSRRVYNCTRLLLNTRSQNSTDPKDKIFAFQGLLSLLGIHFPAPDYSKPVVQVYVEAAATSISHDKSLMILSVLTGESLIHGLPSWVPDWSDNNPITEIASWSDSSATGHNRPKFRISPNLMNITLRGKIIGNVESKSELAYPDPCHLAYCDAGARQLELKALQEWLNKFGDDRKMIKFFREFPRNAWIGTQDPAYLDHGVIPKQWVSSIQSIKGSTIHGYLSDHISSIPDQVQINKVTYKNIRTNIIRFHDLMRTLLDRKRMFCTEDGKLGLGCRALQEGDQIALFSGCRLPMVIRKTGLHWRIICPAYVQGVMDNRKAWRSSEFPLEDFVFE